MLTMTKTCPVSLTTKKKDLTVCMTFMETEKKQMLKTRKKIKTKFEFTKIIRVPSKMKMTVTNS